LEWSPTSIILKKGDEKGGEEEKERVGVWGEDMKGGKRKKVELTGEK